MTKNIDILKEELKLISDYNNREMIIRFLQGTAPDYFWDRAADATKGYGPKLNLGKGGLVRHTKACVMVAKVLLKVHPYTNSSFNKDAAIAALIIHDTFVCGKNESLIDPDHGFTVAEKWSQFLIHKGFDRTSDFARCVTACILWHMGQESGARVKNCVYGFDEWVDEIKFVQLCDYIANCPFITLDSED